MGTLQYYNCGGMQWHLENIRSVEHALDSAIDVTLLSCGAPFLADFIGEAGTYLETKWPGLYCTIAHR